MPYRSRFLALWFICAAVSGCAWFARPDSRPFQEATAEQLKALLSDRASAVQTMKGLFSVQIRGPGIPFAQRVEGALFYRRPDALRLQGFTRLGGELFEFMLAADRYLLRFQKGRVVTGQTTELERMGELAQPLKLSVLAMSGVVGIAPVSPEERVLLVEEGDRYRLDVFQASFSASIPARRIWFDRRALQVVQEERLTPQGAVDVTVRFDDYRVVSSILKPFRITAEDGRGQGLIRLTFHELLPNVPLKPEELRLTALQASSGETRDKVQETILLYETLSR
jgi:outer membrane lipoprotein-sorting protein